LVKDANKTNNLDKIYCIAQMQFVKVCSKLIFRANNQPGGNDEYRNSESS
jgi:hypothetical protein